MTKVGLLKSGKLMNWCMIKRGHPVFALGQGHTSFNHVFLVNTSTSFLKKKKIPIELGNPLSVFNEEQGHSNSSLDLSFGFRSFLDKTNDQVGKTQKNLRWMLQKTKKKILWFMSSTLKSSLFMEKNFSDNVHSITNTKDLTMKQMFDKSSRLVVELDEISGMEIIDRENSSWKYMSLIDDERVINLQRVKFHVFSDSVLCLGMIHENPHRTIHGKKDWDGSNHLRNTRTWTELRRANGIRLGYFHKMHHVTV